MTSGPAGSPAARPNLVNLERVSKAYGVRPLLSEVSAGVGAGDRIGVVGRNGDGKTTLLRILTGDEEPDGGRVSRTRGLRVAFLAQEDELVPTASVRKAVLGDLADHHWAADPSTRETVAELLGGLDLDRPVGALSGGERRRCALAALLLRDVDLLVLDEPTNHLDVEAVAWLAEHLSRRTCALVVVTHDRWFLDEVCRRTWEIHDGQVDAYAGGYAAYVLAKAERQRQAAATEARRQNLVRRELAWLRRGAPARTSKPRFRLEAADALIADEPAPPDRLQLQRLATRRLGKDVVDLEDVDLSLGGRPLLSRSTWRLGAGDRVGLVGVNGAGKTSVLRLLAGELGPDAGRVRRGRTVDVALLRQTPGEHDDEDAQVRVLDSVERDVRVVRTAGRKEGDVTASALLERFGFTGDRLTTRLSDLSGGERRRLELLRLLVGQPNLLLLDEPTNDLDIETLNVVEDFLDGWVGTLVVVSHDRYFLERTCDTVWALLGDGQVRMLPRGVEEYVERRRAARSAAADVPDASAPSKVTSQSGRPPVDVRAERADPMVEVQAERAPKPRAGSAEARQARKTIARIDRQLEELAEREDALHASMQRHAADHERLVALDAELRGVREQRELLEEQWLAAAVLIDP